MLIVTTSMFLFLCGIGCLTVRSRLPPRKKPFIFMEYVRSFKDPLLAVTALSFFIFALGMFIPFTYVLLQAAAIGVPSSLIPYLVTILNAARSVPPQTVHAFQALHG